jgi:hypothetical protein
MTMTLPWRRFLLLFVLCGLAHLPVRAESGNEDRQPEYFFYRGRSFGSESLVHPLRLIINGGFGILQMENRPDKLDRIDWGNGWRNLWQNLASPLAAIDNQGWWEFLSAEVIPISTKRGRSQYWPNYTNHLIGGGMSYRMMREWYRWHGFRREVPWALATITAYHLLNEVVEMDAKQGWWTDPIADFYLFNVGGVLLFSSDRVSRFFSERLHLSDWSFQPLYDPWRGTLENQGQNYMMRLRLGAETPWYLFYHWCNGAELGASRHLGGGRHLSAGAGFRAKDLLKTEGLTETVSLATSFGLFYDRDASLLASAIYTEKKQYRWRLNLYPGTLRIGGLQPGLTLITTRDKRYLVGLTIGSPALPVGLGRRVGREP